MFIKSLMKVISGGVIVGQVTGDPSSYISFAPQYDPLPWQPLTEADVIFKYFPVNYTWVA